MGRNQDEEIEETRHPSKNLELEFIRTLGGLTEELIDISELNYPIIELEV